MRVGVLVLAPYESGVRAVDPGVVTHIRPPNRSVAGAVTPGTYTTRAYCAGTGVAPRARRSTASAISAAGTTMLKPIRIPVVSPTAS